jgi:hypothetical protein
MCLTEWKLVIIYLLKMNYKTHDLINRIYLCSNLYLSSETIQI